MLSNIQKELFLDRSGTEYSDNIGDLEEDESEGIRCFDTPYPYNNREWNLSPWGFAYIIEENGNLITELFHRMTNNRIIGWDKEGKELSREITNKYFTAHM